LSKNLRRKYSPALRNTGHEPSNGLPKLRALTHLVTASHQRSRRDIEEAHVLSNNPPSIELCRLDISIHLHMLLSWSHILAECNNVNFGSSQACNEVAFKSTFRIRKLYS
jgi:hypothetical protein